ncbi:gasdermin-C [Cervus elaphus]|uniref:gasdermin-C n=1 Tax=Cervus elaphus TaxID=9860 RepID=UPI001CC32191|nr:gasdermin-C [Cervus elaphus]
MTSLFEHTNKNLVKELGGKDLKPIQNPQSANKFCLLSLLRQKRRILSQFWKQPDVPVDCILTDILEPSSSVPEPVVTGKFLFSDKMVQTEAAEVDVTAGLEVSASGKASQSYECSLEVQSVTISPRDWEDLQERKVLDQEPPFRKECRTRGDNLYVVTEVVQLINTTVLQDSSSVKGTGKLSIPWSFYVKSTGDRSGLKVRQRTLTLPQGTVMAYKRKQLVFQENGRAILLISHDDKRKTFPEDEFLCCAVSLPRPQFQGKLQELQMSPEAIDLCGHRESQFSPLNTRTDFKSLQNEVSREMEAVAELPRDIRDALFHTILAKLKDQGALQDFTDMLDGNIWIHTGSFLSEMQENSRNVWLESRHIIYLLEALLVLSDIQHELLAWSMEKRILPQQQELVKSILEPNFLHPCNNPFTLDPKLLASLEEEGLAITFGLLQECGLSVAPDNPKGTWDLEAKEPLSTLYGSLLMLQQLAES